MTHSPDNRIVIFGNSGSGKSHLAKHLSQTLGAPHLDLDTIAWLPDITPPTRLPLSQSGNKISTFMANNPSWIIEGSYTTLLEFSLPQSTKIIFLNPGTKTCLKNAKSRPWEPHKFPTPEAQAATQKFLYSWIAQYDSRTDEFGLQAHQSLYNAYPGPKTHHHSNITF